MQKLVKEYLNEWKSRQKKRRRTVIAVMILVVMVVGMVGSVLTQYGIAMTGNAKCGIEEHQHTEACYGESLICDLAEDAGHTHTEACYTEIQELTCGQEESEEHQHTEDCYTESQELICGQEENTGHIHDASCYEEQITCPMEEHVHTEECYIDKEADIESAGDWEKTFSGIDLTDDWAENVAGIAETQEGYLASEDNYELAEDRTTQRRYTRYGQWYGNPYGDEEGHWDTMFAAFCLDYAGVKNVPYGKNIGEWIKKLNETDTENIKRNSEASRLFQGIGYEAAVGDVVFFDDDKDNGLDRCGILTEIVPQTEENDGCYQVVEVKDDRSVVKQEYELDDNRIASWLQVPENPDAAVVSDDMGAEKDLDGDNTDTEKNSVDDDANTEKETDEEEEGDREDSDEPSQDEKLQIKDDDSQSQENLTKDELTASVSVGDKGKVRLELLYGDAKDYNAHPNGTAYYTNQIMTGYIRLYAEDVSGDITLDDMTMTLYFPKDYLKNDSISISKVSEKIGIFSDPVIEPVTIDGTEYCEVKVDIQKFSQTADVKFPFKMQFRQGEVPRDYKLGIYATLEMKGVQEKGETPKYIYRPKYDPPYVTKYANTNAYASMANDGTYIAAMPGENGVLKMEDYASFWFTIGGDVAKSFRAYEKIVLTDTLPTYTDINGSERTAELHPSCVEDLENGKPGWKNNGDGTVSYTPIVIPENYEAARADLWLEEEVKKVELRLIFPDCKMEEKDPKHIIWEAEATNKITANCTPWFSQEDKEAGKKEADDVCEDTIDFILTNQPGGNGSFGKKNSINVLTDTKEVRSDLYKWEMRFENTNSSIPMKNVVFSDYEMDERLMFREIEMDSKDEWKKKVEKVLVWNTEEENPKKFEVSDFEGDKLVLPASKTWTKFEVYLKPDYKMELEDSFHITMWSSFRNPEETQDPNRNTYINKAYVAFQYENSSDTKFLFAQNEFKLVNIYEGVYIDKNLHYEKDIYEAGKSAEWRLQLHGIDSGAGGLAENKEYKDLCLIDLLPQGFEWEKFCGYTPTKPAYVEGTLTANGDVDSTCRSVIDNYKGTGRTALIFKIDAEVMRKQLYESPYHNADIYIATKISESILPGSYTNEIFLVSEDLSDNPTVGEKIEDINDWDGDGKNNDYILYHKKQIAIKTGEGICSQKYIAQNDPTTGKAKDWRTSTLLLTEGEDFWYRLRVKPVQGGDKNLVVYDVLPQCNDKNIAGDARNSDFDVQLRGTVEPQQEGYTVWYTTDSSVYIQSMAEVLDNENVKWVKQTELLPDNFNKVTAIKVVADSETILKAGENVDFDVPVKISQISDAMKESLLLKPETDRSGIAQFLTAVNSFGYRTDGTQIGTDGTGIKESNYVRAKIPFLSLSIKKEGEDTGEALSGARFTLERDDEFIEEKISAKDGKILFDELKEGVYILTETEAPNNYTLPKKNTWTINIVCDIDKNEFRAEIDGVTGSGSISDPLIIKNTPTYELPSTGGSGIYWYMFSGMLLMSAAAGITYRNKRKGVLGS